MSPRISIRNLETDIIDKTQSRLTTHLVSLYKHIKNKFSKEYSPFESNNEFYIENIFGFVVLLEDSYIRREIIHQEAAKILKINTDSDEYKWMCSNLRVVNLYDYEKIVFHDENIFDHLTLIRDNESTWFNFGIYQGEVATCNEMNSAVYERQKVLRDIPKNSVNELDDLNLISK
ncbi:hypothetical protein ABNX05_15535 [Lysinibacillus sp. M3]|uniref:Uncharacterized protein n=1 Tax=Lysinibacillus zambalensis TaxID=3160866 RepID=A0ABV1MU74_9BACI